MNTPKSGIAAHEAAPVELRAGDLRLALRADLGGSIAGLWLGDVPVLRSTEPRALDRARASGSYVLVPYSNRLGYRRFRWLGREHRTVANVDDDMPHSLHGVAWQRRWEVLSATATVAELRYRHTADEHWPFDFEARQRIELGPGHLHATLAITNLGSEPPAGLGWHPYFVKRPRSRLHVEIAERWDNDASGLPVRKVAQPGIDGDVAHLDFDNCFEGFASAARIRDEKLSSRLTSSLRYAVVFTPPTKPYFCVEPVSHVSNAIHMADPAAHGLVSLAPGASFEAWMRLEIGSA